LLERWLQRHAEKMANFVLCLLRDSISASKEQCLVLLINMQITTVPAEGKSRRID
jgi:hypothetical protein